MPPVGAAGVAAPPEARGAEVGSAYAPPAPRSAAEAIERLLRDDPNAVGFFQAVRLLERAHPEREPVGRWADPAREVARFTVPPSISFPASEIQGLQLGGRDQARVAVNFLGLTGPVGVLPYVYTLAVAERARARDAALRDFLDIFHHRLLSLFYRAWEKYRFTVAQEREHEDRLAQHVADLVGFGTNGLAGRLAIHDDSLLFYAGLLAPLHRSAVGLEQLVADYFDVPVTVEQFVGEWYPLGRADQCALDHERAAPSVQLGHGAVVGDEIWDPQARVRLRVGPLTRRRYAEFLPGGRALPALRELVRVYANDELDVELQLVLARAEVPRVVLGGDGATADDAAGALPLGWATWLCTVPAARDPDDTVLTL